MTMPSSSPGLAIVQTVDLPRIHKDQPILLNAIVQDEDGNLYFSDELNHCVTSLNPEGELRWQRGGQGRESGEFHYPRGMSRGVIEEGGKSFICVAIADAWNHRIQFIDLDGNHLATWQKGGEVPFVEVSDVRFVAGVSGTGTSFSTEGCWLVLDKGAHRLFAMDPSGNLLFQTGRCLVPTLEARWAIPGMFFQNDSDLPRTLIEYPPFDFLFYPERILGKSADAIFLTEPFGGTVKQVIYPNLFPVRLPSDHAVNWISADSSGLWAWNPAEMGMVRFAAHCDKVARIQIEGMPVSSDLPFDELWVHRGDSLLRCRWIPHESNCGEFNNTRSISSFILHAKEDRAPLDADKIRACVDICLDGVDQVLRLSWMLLAVGKGEISPDYLDPTTANIRLFDNWRARLLSDFHEALQPWCLHTLKQILFEPKHQEQVDPSIGSLRQDLSSKLQSAVTDIRNRMEELNAAQVTPPTSTVADLKPIDAWIKAIGMAAEDLTSFREMIQYLLGEVRRGVGRF